MLILGGRLALTLARIPGLRHKPLDADSCSECLRKATAGKREIDRLRLSLGRIAAFAQRRGGSLLDSDAIDGGSPRGWYPDAQTLDLVGSPPPSLAHPLPIILKSKGASRVPDDVKPAYMGLRLPHGSLLKPDEALGLPEDVLLAGPELVFLTLARRCSLPKALVLALELCGTYDLAPDLPMANRDPSFLSNMSSAVSPKDLGDFILSMPPRTKGRAVALDASRLAARGSASPMESRLFSMLALPVRQGGYGLEGLELNKQIELNDSDRRILGTSSMRVDIMAGSGRVGIEYESKRWHEAQIDGKRARLDKKRIDVARFHDITILPLTWDIVRDPMLLDEFVTQFARIDGKTLHMPSQSSIDRRILLHGQLFGFQMRAVA